MAAIYLTPSAKVLLKWLLEDVDGSTWQDYPSPTTRARACDKLLPAGLVELNAQNQLRLTERGRRHGSSLGYGAGAI